MVNTRAVLRWASRPPKTRRSSAQGNCSAKSLVASVMSSIIPFSSILHQFFLVLLVFHQSRCLGGGGPVGGQGSSGGEGPAGGGGLAGGGGWGGGGVGGGGRGHFIHPAIYWTTTWCFALKGLRTTRRKDKLTAERALCLLHPSHSSRS